jgi:hypothetical protein
VQVSWKEERKKCQDIPFFQNLYGTENPASYLVSFFLNDTVQVSRKEKRKIWSGIPFSKPLQSVKPCLLFSFLFPQ